jgi:hypothetical protein
VRGLEDSPLRNNEVVMNVCGGKIENWLHNRRNRLPYKSLLTHLIDMYSQHPRTCLSPFGREEMIIIGDLTQSGLDGDLVTTMKEIKCQIAML